MMEKKRVPLKHELAGTAKYPFSFLKINENCIYLSELIRCAFNSLVEFCFNI